MGFLFDPRRKAEAQERMRTIMRETKRQLESAVPFAMEPVVYDFAINERGTVRGAARRRRGADAAGYYTLTVPALLRAESRLLSPRAPRRARPVQRRLPHASRVRRAWCSTCSTAAAARRRTKQAARGEPGRICWSATASTACSTSRFRPTARGPDRAGAEPAAGHQPIEDSAAATCSMRAAMRRSVSASWASEALAAGAVAVVSLAGGIGTPLDQGRGRGEGAQSVLQARRQASQLHRDAPRQEPAHGPRGCGRAAAARDHHQLSDARRHRAVSARRERITAIRGPLLLSPGRAHRAAHGSHGARPALRLGGDAAADARRAGAEGAREPARDADRVGAAGGRGQRLYGQSAAAVPASGGALVRGPEPAAQRRAGAAAGGAAAAAAPDGAQHRHGGRGCRPGAAGLSHRAGRGDDDGGDRAAHGGSRRRPGAGRRARCGWWRAWRCRARRSSRGSRTTTARTYWIDIDRLLARVRADARRSGATRSRWRRGARRWRRACRRTSR